MGQKKSKPMPPPVQPPSLDEVILNLRMEERRL